MIHVDRPLASIPAAWKVKADKETREAIAAYREALKKHKAAGKNAPPFACKFVFKAYGDPQLRAAINHAYRYKCAYCETFYGATQPVAVEHYRPKSEILEGNVHMKPGYYWLAATWDNLLPSCTDCNSPRRQEEVGGTPRLRGKGNYFPLETGSTRADAPGMQAGEKPLLLHPEKDDPEKHLEFLTQVDRLGVVRAALENGVPSPKGEASIEVYALDRPQLTMNRQNVGKRMVSHLRNTRNSLQRHQANPADEALREEYESNIADLRDMIGLNQQYLAMLRAILRAEFPQQAAQLSAIVSQ